MIKEEVKLPEGTKCITPVFDANRSHKDLIITENGNTVKNPSNNGYYSSQSTSGITSADPPTFFEVFIPNTNDSYSATIIGVAQRYKNKNESSNHNKDYSFCWSTGTGSLIHCNG